jgi:formylmethanofuran--tetrahydromethanopterin N-formyltransferase
MEGEFIVEDSFGVAEAVAGGNFLILAKDKTTGLQAAEEAVKAIKSGCKRGYNAISRWGLQVWF